MDYPLATGHIKNKVLSILDSAVQLNLVRKGINEVLKTLERGQTGFVVIASDTEPLEIVSSVIAEATMKNFSYVFVPSKLELGRICGIARPVSAVIVTSSKGDVDAHTREFEDAIATLLI
ncbi:hypothetical protein SELMODRAFT_83348 [Selaginella moellendorffii]|uniref:H/ACA ribonucleoprotein complex subunit 2 n=1 Tax=Selaginella moellendorffii TaxID=88036 RepID=D8R2B5_SELML|nr:13 kDa ribonucleoprotein-associated protein [Selaginella moellendorffii]EFJ33697.1 hypothetical protein SELMODRAFT_83348 [Selaginella moellendorffii]|eukprot:XP_002964859.1 13 kDa ribonucleoprotein-associated protein [Selaginella moellendorffii]